MGIGNWAWGIGPAVRWTGFPAVTHLPSLVIILFPLFLYPFPLLKIPFSFGSAKTTLKDAEISLIGYAIATDTHNCRDYQSVSKKTHTSIEIIRKIAVYFLT